MYSGENMYIYIYIKIIKYILIDIMINFTNGCKRFPAK